MLGDPRRFGGRRKVATVALAACANAGARLIKLFPAQLWTPAALKDVRGVGDFKTVHFLPSGGITPENTDAWLAAGAAAVGMGSKLVGASVRTPPHDLAALAEADADWAEVGRPKAAALFRKYATVYAAA